MIRRRARLAYCGQHSETIVRASALLRGESPDGVGDGGAGEEPAGSVVCATAWWEHEGSGFSRSSPLMPIGAARLRDYFLLGPPALCRLANRIRVRKSPRPPGR